MSDFAQTLIAAAAITLVLLMAMIGDRFLDIMKSIEYCQCSQSENDSTQGGTE